MSTILYLEPPVKRLVFASTLQKNGRKKCCRMANCNVGWSSCTNRLLRLCCVRFLNALGVKLDRAQGRSPADGNNMRNLQERRGRFFRFFVGFRGAGAGSRKRALQGSPNAPRHAKARVFGQRARRDVERDCRRGERRRKTGPFFRLRPAPGRTSRGPSNRL